MSNFPSHEFATGRRRQQAAIRSHRDRIAHRGEKLARDHRLSAVDELGVATTQAYDSAGKVVSTTRAAGTVLARTTTFGYDAQSRKVLTTYPDGSTVSATYHPGGALHTSTDERGNTTTDDDSLLTWQDSTLASFTSFVATATDPLGHTRTSYPAPQAAFGGVNRQVSAAGRVVETVADANGRTVLTRVAPGTTDATTATATYDADGMVLTQTTDPRGIPREVADEVV